MLSILKPHRITVSQIYFVLSWFWVKDSAFNIFQSDKIIFYKFALCAFIFFYLEMMFRLKPRFHIVVGTMDIRV